MKEKIKLLEKEVARLTRRNKILTKRIKKIEEENIKLQGEIEIYEEPWEDEFKSNFKNDHFSICPKCGGEIHTYPKPDGTEIRRCDNFPTCKYKG